MSNRPPMPSTIRQNSNNVRRLWASFEAELKAPRSLMEKQRDDRLKDEDKAWRAALPVGRRSVKEHAAWKDKVKREVELEHFVRVREMWQRRLEGAGLRDEDWCDMTPAETRAVELALGAHLVEEEEDVGDALAPLPSSSIQPTASTSSLQPPQQPPPPPQAPSAPALSSAARSANASEASSYLFVNPKDFGSDDDDGFYFKPSKSSPSVTTISEDEDIGIPMTTHRSLHHHHHLSNTSQHHPNNSNNGWDSSASGYTTTWSTDSLSAQSSLNASPEQVARGLGGGGVDLQQFQQQQQQLMQFQQQQQQFYQQQQKAGAGTPTNNGPKTPQQQHQSQQIKPSSSSSSSKPRIPGPSYIGPHLLDIPDIDENPPTTTPPMSSSEAEASFERFRMSIRLQKIVEFHEEAAKEDIKLALDIYNARREVGEVERNTVANSNANSNSTKKIGDATDREVDREKVEAHERRMRELREEKERERKEVVARERKRLREVLRASSSAAKGKKGKGKKVAVGEGEGEGEVGEKELDVDEALKRVGDFRRFIPREHLLEEGYFAQYSQGQGRGQKSPFEVHTPNARMNGNANNNNPFQSSSSLASASSSSFFDAPHANTQTHSTPKASFSFSNSHPRNTNTNGMFVPQNTSDNEDNGNEEIPPEMMDMFMQVGRMADANAYANYANWGGDDGGNDNDDNDDDDDGWGGSFGNTMMGATPTLQASKPASSLFSAPAPAPPAPAPAPAPAKSGWGIKPSTPLSGWGKKAPAPTPSIGTPVNGGGGGGGGIWGKKSSSILDNDTPPAQVKSNSPFFSALNGKKASPAPAPPVPEIEEEEEEDEPSPPPPPPPAAAKGKFGGKNAAKNANTNTPAGAVAAETASKLAKAAVPTPTPPPAPAPTGGKKANKMPKGKKGANANTKVEPEPEAEPVSPPPPPADDREEEGEEDSFLTASFGNKGKLLGGGMTPKPTAKNQNQNPFDSFTSPASSSSSFKWDDGGPSTPRPTHLRKLSDTAAIRPSGLRNQVDVNDLGGKAKAKANGNGAAWGAGSSWGGGSSWGVPDEEEQEQEQEQEEEEEQPVQRTQEIWVPGGASAKAQQSSIWNTKPAAAAQRPPLNGRRATEPVVIPDIPTSTTRWGEAAASASPALPTGGKKGKAKKNAKTPAKKVTVEEVSDEEGTAGPKDSSEKLPSDSRIILEPRPSAPPAAFSNIFGYDEMPEEEVPARFVPTAAAARRQAKAAPAVPASLDDEDPWNNEWFAAAAKRMQEEQSLMERLHGGGGGGAALDASNMGTIRPGAGSKHVRWTPSVVGDDSPMSQITNLQKSQLGLDAAAYGDSAPSFFNTQQQRSRANGVPQTWEPPAPAWGTAKVNGKGKGK